ncbi:conserved hypothetical protein [Tenacibaculum sp. 190524A05c]|uniref:imm11 family protein n=1 Tax=Tenacibaculum platacis TaxID=3137852 RepID=UPI0031FB37AB
MKYYILQNSIDIKTLGNLPQVKGSINTCHVENDTNFIDKFPFQKIENNPKLSILNLYSKSNLTDLIDYSGIGFSYGSSVISDKLKIMLEAHNCFGVQFFSTYIIRQNKEINNLWQTHIYDIPYDLIDFNNTSFVLKDRDENNKPIQKHLKRMSKDIFLKEIKILKYPKMLFFDKISFKKNMDLDFFFLRNFEGSGNGIISEKLKKEMEKENISGIEFRPIEMTLREWYNN